MSIRYSKDSSKIRSVAWNACLFAEQHPSVVMGTTSRTTKEYSFDGGKTVHVAFPRCPKILTNMRVAPSGNRVDDEKLSISLVKIDIILPSITFLIHTRADGGW